MPETWPEELRPAQMNWGCVYNGRAFTSSLSNSQQIVSFPGAYWRCSLQFSVLTRQQERRLTSLVGRMQGMAGTVNLPTFLRRRTDDVGTLAVVAAATNANAISLNGFTREGRVFSEGDYLTIAGQLYEATHDAVAAGGAAVVQVNKRVRSTIAPGTSVEYRNPYCEMRLTADNLSVDLRAIVGSGTLDLREAF